MEDVQKLFSKAVFEHDLEGQDDGSDPWKPEILAEVRRAIAERWIFLLGCKGKVPNSHFDMMVERMKESVLMLTEIHGGEIPFCPEPSESQLAHKENELGSTSGKAAEGLGEGSEEPSSKSGGSSVSLVPHTFKFLRLETSGNAVWTCIQVGTLRVQINMGLDRFQQGCLEHKFNYH